MTPKISGLQYEKWVWTVQHEIATCRRCPLSKMEGNRPVPFSGPAPNKIAVVGEAPWMDEVKAERPFVGPAGQMLRDALSRAALDPDKLFYVNSAQCAPMPGPRPPTREELDACYVHLRRALNVADPKIVLLAGSVALHRIKPKMKITQVMGKPIYGKKRIWFPVLHPSYINRNIGDKELLRKWRQHIKDFASLSFSL